MHVNQRYNMVGRHSYVRQHIDNEYNVGSQYGIVSQVYGPTPMLGVSIMSFRVGGRGFLTTSDDAVF